MAHILLIEPDRLLSDVYVASLKHDGHEVTVATAAGEAIALLDAQDIHAVILELQLPLHNGLEFLYELRSYPDWQSLPVIIHSFVPPERIEQSLTYKHLHVAEYLPKDQTRIVDLQRAIRQVVA